ncbi:MAG: uracil-DNA glycosylase [Acidimicrobiales bacterium]
MAASATPPAPNSVTPPPPDSLADLEAEVVGCRACPRLVEWREEASQRPPARFTGQDYWGRPIPGFGDPGARLLVIGLAPAAHGGNRTGRVFTGDRSGDWLFRAMWKGGWANQPNSDHLADGLRLDGAWVTAAVRCAPPANKPNPSERDNCLPYLAREVLLLNRVRVIVTLGAFAYGVAWRLLKTRALDLRTRPRFEHGLEVPLEAQATLICSYHPSQQNTFTGTLTERAFDAVFARARELGA